jgi:hypothetical protein
MRNGYIGASVGVEVKYLDRLTREPVIEVIRRYAGA